MALIRQLWSRYRRLITYALVGGINTGVDFVVFTLVHSLTPLAAQYCQGISYTAGIISSFILNRGITFRDGTNKNVGVQIVRFIAVNAVSLIVSMLGIRALVAAGLNSYLAKVVITLVTMAINYFGYKLLVFKVKD